jgi:myo-inositol-1(or 4)-monophosphatase
MGQNPDMKELLQFAELTVREAGKLVKGMTPHCEQRFDKDNGDLVTDGDLRVQDYVTGKINKAFPQHGIISEEADENRPESDHVWILDPIDGTKHFAREVPLYAISLALKVRGEIVLGVVYNPETGEVFSALFGGGVTLNDRLIKCSDCLHLRDSVICVEIPSRHSTAAEVDSAMQKTRALIDAAQRVRILGVTSLGMCWTAKGGFDAYVNLGSTTMEWDVAAGKIILLESGARLIEVEHRLIGANPKLCEQIVEVLDRTSNEA